MATISKIQRIKGLLSNSSQEKSLGVAGEEMGGLTSKLLEDQMSSIKDDIKAKLEETSAFQALKKVDAELSKIREELDPKMIIGVIAAFEEELSAEKEEFSKYIEDKFSQLEEALEGARRESSDLNNNSSESLSQKMEEVKNDFIKDIESRYSSLKEEVSGVESRTGKTTDNLGKSIAQIVNDFSKKAKESEKDTKEFKEKINDLIEKLRSDLISRISSLHGQKGGGSMNRQMKVGGVDVLTKYTDINLIGGAGITITTANDNTDKNVDITFSSAGAVNTFTGTVNGVNQTFVFATAPNALSVDNVPRQKTSSDGTVNWTGTTTVVLTVAPNFDLFALN